MNKGLTSTAETTSQGPFGHGPAYFLRYAKNGVIVRAQRTWRRFIHPFRSLPTVELEMIVPAAVEVEPPILTDICLPPYYMFKDHDDYTPLMKIVKSLQPDVVVELGTAYGNTTANICRHSPGTTVYTVNAPLEVQTGTLTTYHLTAEEIGRVYREEGFSKRVVQIFANTLQLDLSEHFDAPIVDLAIVDACHDTDYVINDFLKVKDFIKPGGMVLFHDTFPSMTPSHLDGSYKACLILRRRGYDVRHLKNSWWALWINRDSD